MNFKRIVKHIYLLTVTLIYMVAVAIVLVGIVGFAILDEIIKRIQPSQKYRQSKQRKLEYTKFEPIKASALSSKEKHLWS